MDKLLFFMHRKDGLSRRQFFEHYLEVHTLIGMRVCLMMDGYTVNLTDDVDPGPDGPDSITELWTRDVEAFSDTDRNFRNREEMAELVTDDRSFIGTNLRWLVEEECSSATRPPVRCGRVRRGSSASRCRPETSARRADRG